MTGDGDEEHAGDWVCWTGFAWRWRRLDLDMTLAKTLPSRAKISVIAGGDCLFYTVLPIQSRNR